MTARVTLEFVECDTCRALPGTPPLCGGCLHNRAVIAQLLAGRSKVEALDEATPGWRDLTHPNGAPMFTADGMLLDDQGGRSIFDDVDA